MSGSRREGAGLKMDSPIRNRSVVSVALIPMGYPVGVEEGVLCCLTEAWQWQVSLTGDSKTATEV